MAHYNNIGPQSESDVKYFLQLMIRNYKLFVYSLFFTLLMAFMANRFMTPIYKVSSSILITEESRRAEGNNNEYLNSNLFSSNQNLQNELWILKSVPTLNQTIESLNLTINYYQKDGWFQKEIYGKAPFEVLLLSSHVQPTGVQFNITIQDDKNYIIEAEGKNVSFSDLKTGETDYVRKKWLFKRREKFGNLIETKDLAFMVLRTDRKLDKLPSKGYSFSFSNYTSLNSYLKSNLELNIVDRMATVVEISFKSPSIKKGKDIVNELMSAYSQQNLEHKNHLASVTINYIERQLNEISDSLSITEESLQNFRSSNQLLEGSQQADNISVQYLDLQNQLAELTTRKRYYDYVSEYLNANDDYSSMIVPASMGIPDQLLNNLMSELITSQTERSNLIQNGQEFNPLVKKLTIEIDNIKETIFKNITAVRKTTEISVDEMNKRIRQLEASISRMPVTQLQLGGLERKYKLNDAIYNYLLEKRAEAKITLASNIPNNIIIGPAHRSGVGPVSPNKQINYAVALFLGLLFPIAYLTLRNTLNTRIDNQESIEKLTSAPVLGMIKHQRQTSRNNLYALPSANVLESFRALRTNLEFQFMTINPKTILITSSIENEGKTFIARNLAYSYSQLGFRTLLMNFDLRKCSPYFSEDEDTTKGIYSWYAEGVDCYELISHSPYENFDFVQCGYLAPDPAKLLLLKDTGQLLDQLKKNYDCIIIDTSPIALVSDAYLLMEHADIKLVIARYNHSIKNVFSLIMKDLMQKNIRNVGVVMNDNQLFSNQYGYGYGYNNHNGKGNHFDKHWKKGKHLETTVNN